MMWSAVRVFAALVAAPFATGVFAQTDIPLPLPRPRIPPQTIAPIPMPHPAWRAAAEGVPLSLADAIFMGLRNNRTIKSAYINRIAEKFDLRVAEDMFAPRFAISGAVSRQRIGGVHSTSMDVSPGVNALLPTGASFKFAWNNSLLDTEGSRSVASVAEITLEQPLLQGAGFDVTMAPLRGARLGEQIRRLRLKASVSDIVGQIIFAHRDLLLAQEEVKLAEAAVVRAQGLLTINAALIAAGRMAAVDAVQTEANLESQRLRVLQVRQRVEVTRLALVNLLALDLGTQVVARETLKPAPVTFDLASLMSIALAQRPDYQGQLYVIEQNQLGMTVAENEQLWDLAVFARGRLGNEYSNTASATPVSDMTVGLRFNITVDDPVPKQQFVRASAGLQEAELQLIDIRQGVEMQIRGSIAEISTLWPQLAIAEKSHVLAGRAVEIEKEKLSAGRSSTFQVRSLEDALRAAESQLLGARIGYLNALTRLDLELGTTLETWRIALNDA